MRSPLPRIVLLALLLPIASAADVFDDGGTHDVDYALTSTSFVQDGPGGAQVHGGGRAGASVGSIEAEDSSVLNLFLGAIVGFLDYQFSSSGSICGGTIQQLDVTGTSSVEVSGGSFSNGSGGPLRATGGTLILQAGSFENTAGSTALLLGGDVIEMRGGTVVNGTVDIGAGDVTISGGSIGSNQINSVSGGTLTLVGSAFNLPFGPIAGLYNGPLTGTLADGTALSTTLFKSAGSSVTLVAGTQGPLTSAVCGPLGPHIPALPMWAIALALLAMITAARRPLATPRH